MGVKVRQWKDSWWVFVNHKGKRKAKRTGPGVSGQRIAKVTRELTDEQRQKISDRMKKLQAKNAPEILPENPLELF